MARRSSISAAKAKIENYFDNEDIKVYTTRQLEHILNVNRYGWGLPNSYLYSQFILFLSEKSKLQSVTLDFSTEITRYIWGGFSDSIIYELAISLKPKAYLSHYTAMFFHNLTEQVPKNIFVSYEQPEKKGRDELNQLNIDNAFKKPVRETSNYVIYNNYKITLLNGKYANNTGIVKTKIDYEKTFLVTNLERTLIDIAVRPIYSGGIFEVLKAYQNAKNSISVNKLKAYLTKLNFIYPYHQVIGFYLEKAGIDEKRLAFIEKSREMTFDFYLTHDMKECSYSKRWKLHYPTILDNV